MTDDNLETIKETVGHLLEKMDFEGQVLVNKDERDELAVNIQTEEAGFLIGQSGVNLDAFQHLIKVIIGKKTGQPIHFIIDINNYRKHRIDLLKELAKDIAKQAMLKRTALVLQPMPSYERRIIHTVLAEYPGINTESVGQEPERRVVVKPTP
jgi:spoIIIJ-associated protein